MYLQRQLVGDKRSCVYNDLAGQIRMNPVLDGGPSFHEYGGVQKGCQDARTCAREFDGAERKVIILCRLQGSGPTTKNVLIVNDRSDPRISDFVRR